MNLFVHRGFSFFSKGNNPKRSLTPRTLDMGGGTPIYLIMLLLEFLQAIMSAEALSLYWVHLLFRIHST